MYKVLLSFIAVLLIINPAQSQKIGIVMSGGGAKGLYHIGVLRALEENSIPIDYIAGTSMGAIVGGLYAAGYSPDEIAEIAISGQLSEWMSGRIDNNYGAYFREHNQFFKDDPLLSVRVNTKDKKKRLHLPRGIIPSIQVDMALCSYLAPAGAACDGDFNNLMVPFLCVASDIASNRQKVVFRHGDLARSVRASMALPIAFMPIKDDGMTLYDGGISDNFPWRPMIRAFNPDIMIGISCSAQEDIEADDVSIIDNVFLLTMNRTDYNMPPERSIFIERDVPAGTLDFSQSKMIIEMGYEDAMKNMDSIKLRTTRRISPEEFNARRVAFRAKSPELIFDSYNVVGLTPEQTQYVHGYMATSRKDYKFMQREMSYEELRTNLYSILSSDNFATEFPEIRYNERSGKYSFTIQMEHKPQLKFALGGNLSSTPFNQIYLSMDYTAIGKSAKTIYAELYLGPVYITGIAGGRIDLFRRTPIFIDAYACFSSKNLRHGKFGNLTDITNTEPIRSGDNYLSLGFGAPISKRMMFTARANFGLESVKYDEQIANPAILNISEPIDETNLRLSATKAEFERITFDKPLFPTRGSKLTISGIFLHGKESNSYSDDKATSKNFETIPTRAHTWYGARLKYDKYITSKRAGAWFSMGINLDGVFSNVDKFATDIATYSMLPAYQPTLHSKMVFMPEFSAQSYAAGGLIPQFTLAKNFYAQAGVYAMFRERYVDASGSVLFPIGAEYSMQFISDLALIYHTRFGPLSLALTKYNFTNRDNMYLTFNFGQSIFSPKGMFY